MPTKMARRLSLGALFIVTVLVSGQTPVCQTYKSKGKKETSYRTLTDTISVTDAFYVGSVDVTVDISHRRIGALVVSVRSGPSGVPAITSAVLKERGLGRLGDNMISTTFSDSATASFPVPAESAPFTGTFKPTQRLSFFAEDNSVIAGEGGSRGDWTLVIDDVAPNNDTRPIALNGWQIKLCPRVAPTPSVTIRPVPSPAPAPVPTTPPPTTTNNNAGAPPVQQFAGPSPQPTSSFLGWTVKMKPATGPSRPVEDDMIPAVEALNGPSQTNTGASGLLSGYGTSSSASLPSLTSMNTMFRDNFNGYLLSRYGEACTDPQCTNIKAKFWKAAIMMMYLKAAKEGRIDIEPQDIIEKIREILPGQNPLLGKLADAARSLDFKKDDLLQRAAGWWDTFQQHLVGNMGDLGSLFHGLSEGNPESLKALSSFGIGGAGGPNLGALFGLENNDEMKALMEGLHEAGFQDLMKEFLMESRRRRRR